MIYKFKSKSSGDVIMMSPNGDQLMRIIGRQPAPKGIIEASQMPAAIAALEKAVADDEAAREQVEQEAIAKGEQPPPREGVSLRQRVWPMIDMMRRSVANGHDIVWGV
ncbi:MAG TPA: DUF1840 domain-containing protein [Burkholderiaceae bacterium]|nr:DUF1840 domain-containing protein [Burkholderiaceae bacterium]